MAKWPNIELIHEPARSPLRWKIRTTNAAPLTGEVARAEDAVYVGGEVADVAMFALWVRTLIPTSQALLLYNQGYSAHIALADTTTEAEIVKIFFSQIATASDYLISAPDEPSWRVDIPALEAASRQSGPAPR